MNGHGSKLTRKMDVAIAALLSERNIEDAAKVAGISSKTLRRWLKLPVFQEAYRKASGEVTLDTIARMQKDSGAARIVIMQIMADPKEDSTVRLKAAALNLNYSLKGVEMGTENFEARLGALEHALGTSKDGNTK